MQPYARSLIPPLAVSLCVLCAFAVSLRFAVRLRNPGSNQDPQKRVFRHGAKFAKDRPK
jgi:hypothetical protein